MRLALYAVGLMMAAALAVPGTAVASPARDIFFKHGLFGGWAVNCSRPPSPANPYVFYRLIDGEHVQRWVSIAPGDTLEVSTINRAVETSPTELVISWQTGEGGIVNRILLREDRMKVIDSTSSTGQKLYVGGRRVRDKVEAPWFVRCGTGAARAPLPTPAAKA
jgi:hypothetical protein